QNRARDWVTLQTMDKGRLHRLAGDGQIDQRCLAGAAIGFVEAARADLNGEWTHAFAIYCRWENAGAAQAVDFLAHHGAGFELQLDLVCHEKTLLVLQIPSL